MLWISQARSVFQPGLSAASVSATLIVSQYEEFRLPIFRSDRRNSSYPVRACHCKGTQAPLVEPKSDLVPLCCTLV